MEAIFEHVPDSLTHVFHTADGREVRDGGGIKPDIEVQPDSLPNICFLSCVHRKRFYGGYVELGTEVY